MSKAKVYPLDTINGTVELDIAGEYFKLLVAPAAVAEIELLNDGNQALQALDVPAGFYQRIRFNKMRIRHTGAQAIKVLVAPAEGGSDNFTGTFTAQGTLGTFAQQLVNGTNTLVVKVLERFNDEVTKAGEAFLAYAQSTAVGTEQSYVQVWNPAASGKVLYVDLVELVGVTAAGSFSLKLMTAALTSLSAAQGANKDKGGAAPGAQIRTQNSTVGLGGDTFYTVAALTGQTSAFRFDPPVRLGEGEGLAVKADADAQVTKAAFQWREKSA